MTTFTTKMASKNTWPILDLSERPEGANVDCNTVMLFSNDQRKFIQFPVNGFVNETGSKSLEESTGYNAKINLTKDMRQKEHEVIFNEDVKIKAYIFMRFKNGNFFY